MARQDPYLYEDVPMLRNLPGIKNIEALKQAEGDLTNDNTLGVSNVVTSDHAVVSVKEGDLLLFHHLSSKML